MKEKQKIEGVDNKELMIFFSIIAVIIVLIVFEMFFFKGRPEVEEETAQMQEQLKEMQSTTVAKEQKTVYKALNGIIEKINNKDYKALYSMLKDDYKNYYFREYEQFEQFIKSYARQEYYAKYNAYYRDGNLYYIMIEFLQAKYTREDLLKNRINKVDTIVLEETTDGDFKFAMNGFVENISHNKSKTVDGITFTLQSSVRNTETMKTSVVISNNSDKVVHVNTSNLQPEISGSITTKVSVTTSVNLEPGQVGILDIEYYFQYNSGREFNGITITGAKFDDGTVIDDVYIAK